jgi:hypothetical protein
MKRPGTKYTPSHEMKPGYLARRFAEIRRQQEAERKGAEAAEAAAKATTEGKVRTLARKP